MRSSMSIVGLYNYDPTIFDNFHYPGEVGGDPYYGPEVYVEAILMDAADLELLYPDPVFMKRAIQKWSGRMLNSWQAIAAALTKAYNPIENYNRTETWTDTDSRTENWTDTDSRTESWTNSRTGTDGSTVTAERTDNLKQVTTEDNNTDTSDDTTVNQDNTTSAMSYNTSSWKAATKDEGGSNTIKTGNIKTDNTQTVENTGTQKTVTTSTSNTSDTGSSTGTIGGTLGRSGTTGGSVSHTGNVSGNIGVTTSQQMVEQEVELRVKYQLVNIITRQFIEKFCILVY